MSSFIPPKKAIWNAEPLPGVKRIIAVASGKGGVGKSTTAVNLAHALTRAGKRVGLLDADIYGPSIPRMMKLDKRPEVNGSLLVPLISYGIECMSIGAIAPGDGAIVWRGPQVTKALRQMLRGVAWGLNGKLDILLIDMPPGTGDIHLSLAQEVPVDSAIIVTTPQDVAVIDARKCLDMFRKVKIPIAGVIENMSYFLDPTGGRHAIFGEGGGKRMAEKEQVPFLGEIPLITGIREASDAGEIPATFDFYNVIAAQLAHAQ